MAWFGTEPKRLVRTSRARTLLAGLPTSQRQCTTTRRSPAFSWRREARARTRRAAMVVLLCASQPRTTGSRSSSGSSRRQARDLFKADRRAHSPLDCDRQRATLPSRPSSSTGPSASSPAARRPRLDQPPSPPGTAASSFCFLVDPPARQSPPQTPLAARRVPELRSRLAARSRRHCAHHSRVCLAGGK